MSLPVLSLLPSCHFLDSPAFRSLLAPSFILYISSWPLPSTSCPITIRTEISPNRMCSIDEGHRTQQREDLMQRPSCQKTQLIWWLSLGPEWPREDDSPLKRGGVSTITPLPGPWSASKLPREWGTALGWELFLAEGNSEDRLNWGVSTEHSQKMREQVPWSWRSLCRGCHRDRHRNLDWGTVSYHWKAHKDLKNVIRNLMEAYNSIREMRHMPSLRSIYQISPSESSW